MEIPYIVEPRKDTGLFNSKIAIWLFLASEVMLFGGLFSAYIFLRLGADFPWPERALPVVPGLINTAILIVSSMTVVFAWAQLKLRNWRMFQVYMTITILCAAAFMWIKLTGEYPAKFGHQAIATKDHCIVEGHVRDEKKKGDKTYHAGSIGNYLRVASTEIDTAKGKAQGLDVKVNVDRFYPKYFETILAQAEGKFTSSLYLGANNAQGKAPFIAFKLDNKEYKFDSSSELTVENLETLKAAFVAARSNDNNLTADLHRKAWKKLRADLKDRKYPELEGKPDRVLQKEVKNILATLKDEAAKEGKYINFLSESDKEAGQVPLTNTLTFNLIGEGILKFTPAKGTFGGGTTLRTTNNGVKILHRDKTEVLGVATAEAKSGIEIAVDTLDFQLYKMRHDNDDFHNKVPIEKILGFVDENGKYHPPVAEHCPSILTKKYYINYLEGDEADKLAKQQAEGVTLMKIWETHCKWAHYRKIDIGEGKELTKHEKYTVTWKQMVAYHNKGYKMDSMEDFKAVQEDKAMAWYTGMYGADHYNKEWVSAFPSIYVDRSDIRIESNLTPKWNNYYAIYFTITGLHGLHVIGGALVLAYYLFFGRKMFLSNPEWLANRVEVGGLFWHFVDLVWIFAFPIFYLM